MKLFLALTLTLTLNPTLTRGEWRGLSACVGEFMEGSTRVCPWMCKLIRDDVELSYLGRHIGRSTTSGKKSVFFASIILHDEVREACKLRGAV